MQNYNLPNCTKGDENSSFRLWCSHTIPQKACALWIHPVHMLLMASNVLNKHGSPTYCTLRNLTYGHQHLWIVQSTILHDSLLNCSQLSIVLFHLMELEFYFTLYLFLSLISIWQSSFESMLPSKKILSVIPTGIVYFENKTEGLYKASDKHLKDNTHWENHLTILSATEYNSRYSFRKCF